MKHLRESVILYTKDKRTLLFRIFFPWVDIKNMFFKFKFLSGHEFITESRKDIEKQ